MMGWKYFYGESAWTCIQGKAHFLTMKTCTAVGGWTSRCSFSTLDNVLAYYRKNLAISRCIRMVNKVK